MLVTFSDSPFLFSLPVRVLNPLGRIVPRDRGNSKLHFIEVAKSNALETANALSISRFCGTFCSQPHSRSSGAQGLLIQESLPRGRAYRVPSCRQEELRACKKRGALLTERQGGPAVPNISRRTM